MQRTAGNAAVCRALARKPKGTIVSDGKSAEIDGSTITAKGGPDAETAREMQIARGLDAMMTHARLRMLESRNQMHAATESFRDYAIVQIDGMDGSPSDYWGFVNIATGLAGSIVSIAFPPAALAVAISSAIVGAVKLSVTADVAAARADAKEKAKAAMRGIATGVRDGFDKGSEKARATPGGPIYKAAWMWSLTDDDARVQFESGQTADLDALCDRAGVTDPAAHDLFAPTLRQLNGEFGAWLGKAKFNQDHTVFDQLLADADPTSDQFRERKALMDSGKAAGVADADKKIEARNHPTP
jgi:hypothetical protein